MRFHTLRREQWVPRPLEEVFAFFSDAANLQVITPDWLDFRILTPTPIEMQPGVKIEYALRWHGLPVKWTTEIEEWTPPNGFIDLQRKGPYNHWRHVHRFREEAGGTAITDVVEYALPFGPLGRLAHALRVREDIVDIFDYRAGRIKALFHNGKCS